jgi:hypothetical protein
MHKGLVNISSRMLSKFQQKEYIPLEGKAQKLQQRKGQFTLPKDIRMRGVLKKRPIEFGRRDTQKIWVE